MNLLDWWYGVVGLSITATVIYTLVVTHLTIMSVTLYLHRHSAHRALDLHPALAFFFRAWLWLTTGMSTKQWTAIHRKHHALVETKDDPHSPQVHGLKEIFWKGTEYYRAGATEETLEKYGKGTPDDWWERHVFTAHSFWGIGTMAVVDVALFGSLGIVIWAVQMLWIPVLAAGVINGVGHAVGYRNFETPDASANIVPWGILIGGEELHNNHHTYPNSAKFSVKPWEFDAGWFWIRVFSAFGLAKPRSTGPIVARANGKMQIDMDTVWGALNDRFRVMSHYAESVVGPLAKLEIRRADGASRRLLRRAKNILCREEMRLGERDRRDIKAILESSPSLKTIYEKRLELNAVWAKRGGSRDDLLKAFKDWCVAAENTGIQVLRDFVAELKSYTMPLGRAVA
ncbi:MAG: fatty acid desaturase [Gammaproteobacteria bacterium]|nr:fatty acid desaturase [Gammaproteobacteria bacterium]